MNKLPLLIFFLFFCSSSVFSAPEPVLMSQQENRKVAQVEGLKKPSGPPSGFVDREIYYFENSIMSVARTSSKIAGAIVDRSVDGSVKACELLFSPIVRALDVKSHFSQGK